MDDEFSKKVTTFGIRIVAISLNSIVILLSIGAAILTAITVIGVLNWAIMRLFG